MINKADSDQLIIHFVNYLNNVRDHQFRLDLTFLVGDSENVNFRLYSPDDVPKEVKSVPFSDRQAEFTIPELKTYNMAVVN